MALEQNSGYANAFVNMGLFYNHQNQIGDALKNFEAAEKCDPKNIAAIVNIGVILYENKKNYEDAAIRFLDALEIKPDDEEEISNPDPNHFPSPTIGGHFPVMRVNPA